MDSFIAELHKRQGICYAVTDDGIEVPVIDLTHPAFPDELDARDYAAAAEKAAADVESRGRMSAEEVGAHMRGLLKGSFLAPRIAAAQGTVLSGMSTYYLKLGPDNLPSAVAAEVDREIARSLPCVSARLRLRHTARLLADSAAPLMRSRPGMPLHMLNIAGGPCMDSVNALLLIAAEHPGLLSARRVVIHCLDPDTSGPRFGARALQALRSERSAFSAVSFIHTLYDWSRPTLSDILPPLHAAGPCLIVGSSEGGLFEYGSDEEILANLRALRDFAPADALFVGSVTRTEGVARVLNTAGGAALHLRTRDAFQTIVREAGWRISQVQESPLSYEVTLSIIVR
jgi:hypothetical protein